MNDIVTDIMSAFKSNKKVSSNIIVIGVGGAGCNVIEEMYRMGIHNVMFMACNTDRLALDKKPIPLKVGLGESLTKGLGAGADPIIGRDAALESEDTIRKILEDLGIKMAFITAGMGGGTGTGAAPEITRICRELGILTVGFVTVPQAMEGPKRMRIAKQGLTEIVKYLDSILIVDNQSIVDIYSQLPDSEQFNKADEILAESAKGMAEIITVESRVNIDLSDVRTTLRDKGITIIGTSSVSMIDNDNYIDEVINNVIHSPLLMQTDISGAREILLNITWNGKEPLGVDIAKIMSRVQEEAGGNNEADIIYGKGVDDNLTENHIKIVMAATNFVSTKDKFGLYDKSSVVSDSTESILTHDGDLLNSNNNVNMHPVSASKFSDNKVTLKPENIEYITSMSLSELENTPAYKRYKIDINQVPSKGDKILIKLEVNH